MSQVPVSYTIGLIRYAITDASCTRADAERWVAAGVDFVQLRDKNVAAGALMSAARMLVELLGAQTRLLVNGRADIALAAGAAGVHLTAHPDELTPEQVRRIFSHGQPRRPVISVSCHTVGEAARAADAGADWILFGPVFEKHVKGDFLHEGSGLKTLEMACQAAPGKVLALGGVSKANTADCLSVGASGVAGIRLFT